MGRTNPIKNQFKNYLYLILVVLLLHPVTLVAQSLEDIPRISLNDLGYVVKRWSVDDGLPHDTIEAITQTKDGFIWVGTRSGLARFNGSGFRVFDSLKVEEFADEDPGKYDWFISLHGDESGKLWIGVQPNVIAVYENGVFTLLDQKYGFPGGNLQGFIEGTNGEIIVRTDGKPLQRIEQVFYRWRRNRFEEIQLPVPFPPTNRKKEFWALQSSQSLPGLESELDSGQNFFLPVNNMLFSMDDDRTAVFTTQGIYTRESKGMDWLLSHPILNAFEDKYIWADTTVCESPDGYIWIEGAGPELIVRLRDGQLRRVHLPGMTRPFFDLVGGNIYCDREGNVWVSAADGLYQLTPSPIISWQMDLEAPGLSVYSVSQDGSGRMWFAARGGVYHLNNGDLRVSKSNAVTSSHDWLLVGAPEEGAILLSRNGGLSHVLPDSIERLKHLEIEKNPGLSFSATTGRVWIENYSYIYSIKSSENGLLQVDQSFDYDQPKYGVNDGIAEDSEGRIYLSAPGIGFSVIPKIGETPQPLTPAHSPEGKAVIGPQVDPEGRVWILCLRPYGIGCWDGERWMFASYRELGLSFNEETPGGLMPDLLDGLWLTTMSDGVFRLGRQSLYSYMQGRVDEIDFERLTIKDGLVNNACSFHRLGIFRDRDGRIWVAGNRGVTMIDPSNWDAVVKRFPPPPVMIDTYLLDDVRQDWGGSAGNRTSDNDPEIMIEPGTTRLEIRYTALHYARPSKVEYRYQLEGFDADWVEARNRQEAYYSQLAPGKYRFHVIASNSHDLWNEEGAFASIVVLPAWWQTIWFRGGLGFAALAFIGGLRIHQLNRLQEEKQRREEFSRRLIDAQETERKRIAPDLHDGLGQKLLVIKNGLVLSSRKFSSDSPASQCLKQFAETVRESINEVRSISQNLRPHQIDQLGITTAIESILDRLESSSSVSVQRKLENIDSFVDKSDAIHLLRIVQEATSNAMRHASASRIRVELRSSDRWLHLRVEDDGVGFDLSECCHAQLNRGLGLSSMEERARILGGNWACVSKPGKGTVIEVSFPRLDA